ncbi:hypothetical protein VN23_06565 [Janthinobacterium sp. B9-8]|nr:hypothetical protein VN23_06565 [Janthinobacterium sp. B9-8]
MSIQVEPAAPHWVFVPFAGMVYLQGLRCLGSAWPVAVKFIGNILLYNVARPSRKEEIAISPAIVALAMRVIG